MAEGSTEVVATPLMSIQMVTNVVIDNAAQATCPGLSRCSSGFEDLSHGDDPHHLEACEARPTRVTLSQPALKTRFKYAGSCPTINDLEHRFTLAFNGRIPPRRL